MTSKYAAAHQNLQGPGDARPTALQIVKDENLEGKWSDKTILITGCSSGIGVETARALAATGATLYLTARDLERGRTALADILSPGRVELLDMDLSSLASVRTAAETFLAKDQARGSPGLNILICNAGVMAVPSPGTTTVDGFETQFGTNHLGHFLLFNLLAPSLLKASQPAFRSRVVMVSSSGHRTGGIRIGDYGFANKADYSPFVAYGQSKTANIYMANYIDRHLGPKGIHALSLHPGGIWTGLQKHVDAETAKVWRSAPGVDKIIKSTEQGAATTVWAATAKEWEGTGGKFLEDCQVSSPAPENAMPGQSGYAKHAYDPEKEDRLWADSLEMVGLKA